MSQDTLDWTDTLALSELPEEVIIPITIGDKPLVLYRMGDDIRAFEGKCPHKGAPMEQGVACRSRYGDVQLVCPWHKATFSAESGRLIEPPALDPLKRYPVEVHDGRVLVGNHPMTGIAPQPMRDYETVAIVGAGAAAVAAAVTLREEGYAGRIMLISPEDEAPYDRTALSKMVLGSGKKDAPPPPLRPADWYETHRVERLVDRVVKLDLQTRLITLEKGNPFTPDHILLASGSRARRLDIPGAELDNVRVLRSASDAEAIIASVDDKTSVVVIGSGFIGMEAASALRKRGAGVTVVSQTELPFQKQLGDVIAGAMLDLHVGKGVAFIPQRKAKAIEGEKSVTGVTLDDDSTLTASLVLVGIGAEPVLDYLPDYVVNKQGGLDVDPTMKIAPDIYAVGDIASVEHNGHRYRIEHWRTAQCQARIAARTMLGLPGGELPTPWFWTQQYDRKIEYLGWPQAFDRVEIEGDAGNFDFTANYLKGDKIVGIATAGRPKEMGEAVVTFEDA